MRRVRQRLKGMADCLYDEAEWEKKVGSYFGKVSDATRNL